MLESSSAVSFACDVLFDSLVELAVLFELEVLFDSVEFPESEDVEFDDSLLVLFELDSV